jgi:hypothetical protein
MNVILLDEELDPSTTDRDRENLSELLILLASETRIGFREALREA